MNYLLIGSVVAVALVAVGVNYAIIHLDSNDSPPTEPAPQQAPPASEPPAEQPVPTKESEAPAEQPVPPKESEAPVEQPPLTLEQKIEKMRKAIAEVVATCESKEVTLVFTETEANDLASILLTQFEMPEDIPLQIGDVHIDFQTGNNVVTEAETAGSGLKITLKVTSHVSIEEGKPVVEVTDINLPLPQSLKDQVDVLVKEKTMALLDQLTQAELVSDGEVELEYTDIDIQEEELTITLLIKPSA
ncbi:hypothetical protein ACFLUO_02800 [Chloroflexota bacterium]